MGKKETVIWTRLAIRECGATFEKAARQAQGIGSKMAGLGARIKGGRNDLEFYTPDDNSPFATLDDDAPDFSVGVHVPRFYGGAIGNATNVQMQVWDRGSEREVLVISNYPVGGGTHAGQIIKKLVAAFTSADSAARIGVE